MILAYQEILARLGLAVIAGGLIGLEREIVHKPAGIRTHMLVCLGSALFILVAVQEMPDESARVMAGIATGIGFLGAGTIFMAKNAVHGLTTAASIWAVAAVGLTLGLGYYIIALISVVLIAAVLQLNRIKFFREL
ncbi:MgtC/SapB family protein [Candidatus Woesearchaeota archaeon]|nr:MgtC/SapB family protein [Candidatus Woesearchaeota archaeon]MBI2130500.1 MgtC/SapB family protein [Candidatus Woesearchaeota archaeon]